MAHRVKNRVLETTSSTGTGAVTLQGAETGYVAFGDVLSDGDLCWVCIEAVDGDGVPTGQWEISYATFNTGIPNTITRTTLIASSTGSAVSFSAGTKRVFLTEPATVAGSYVDVQEFTADGTWTKPAGAKMCLVTLRGGGGGGGSGRRGAAATNRSGGGGGAAGADVIQWVPASEFGATESVDIGAGGGGGASQTSDSSNGNSGTAGSSTTIGNLMAQGGGGGAGGEAVTTTAGGIGQPGGIFADAPLTTSFAQVAGGATGKGNSAGSNGLGWPSGAGSGAGGGGVDAANTHFAGGIGGYGWNSTGAHEIFATATGGTAGTSGGGNGGSPGTIADSINGMGGGGGGGNNAGAGGAGGNGGNYGGGGGGGGGCLNGNNSGAGGNGGNGYALVITYCHPGQ